MLAIQKFCAAALVSATLLALPAVSAANERSSALAKEAGELLDEYFGESKQLVLAAKKLEQAYDADPNDANVYIQAARLAIKDGMLNRKNFRPGSRESYGNLLDRAMQLDPTNAKPHILKAEYFYLNEQEDEELAELDKAKSLGTRDPWLLVGYGRHYSYSDRAKGAPYYRQVVEAGPGSTLEDRNAYLSSLKALASLAADERDIPKLQEIAALVVRERHPRDAWSFARLSDLMLYVGQVDEALALARSAIKTMDYGSGRLTLATALYAKAAMLISEGKDKQAAPLIREAARYGFSRDTILSSFESHSDVYKLRPIVAGILE